mmetsp:Transcript_112718/g.283451  ORF Transcript_112718/g.283451 Transcript_112718/m.283451 type:complete len:129 (-) Transcript_112718:2426-2812(-)
MAGISTGATICPGGADVVMGTGCGCTVVGITGCAGATMEAETGGAAATVTGGNSCCTPTGWDGATMDEVGTAVDITVVTGAGGLANGTAKGWVSTCCGLAPCPCATGSNAASWDSLRPAAGLITGLSR